MNLWFGMCGNHLRTLIDITVMNSITTRVKRESFDISKVSDTRLERGRYIKIERWTRIEK